MIMVILIPFEDYMSKIIDIIKKIYSDSEKVCYISLNKPLKALALTFKQKDYPFDKVFVIDTVTKTVVDNPQEFNNCEYVSSPTAFSEILETLGKVLMKEKIGIVVFDSISTQLIYEKEETVIKFLRTISTRISVAGIEGLFPCLKEDVSETMGRQISTIADKVVDMTKKS